MLRDLEQIPGILDHPGPTISLREKFLWNTQRCLCLPNTDPTCLWRSNRVRWRLAERLRILQYTYLMCIEKSWRIQRKHPIRPPIEQAIEPTLDRRCGTEILRLLAQPHDQFLDRPS